MGLFKRKKQNTAAPSSVQTARSQSHPFSSLDGYIPLSTPESRLYESIREAIPIVDAALYKIIRLTGGMQFFCWDQKAQEALSIFAETVQVGTSSVGMESFLGTYLDNLLLYGNAVGEIVVSKQARQIVGLYNASLRDIEIRKGADNLSVDIFSKRNECNPVPVTNPQLVLFTALNPEPGEVRGVSILRSLPFVTSVLLKIYNTIGLNFERIGNVRFAVTYRPGNDTIDRAYAKERAMEIAKEWAQGMAASKNGVLHDFVSVGDVDIRVIGADNQIIDTEVPVKQMLEQIIAKLSIPPFMLGLNWSTTERMSKQQTTILTSEIDYYRRLLTPIAMKIARFFLRLNGFTCEPTIEWDSINFDEDIEAGQARLYMAQAENLEIENQKMIKE